MRHFPPGGNRLPVLDEEKVHTECREDVHSESVEPHPRVVVLDVGHGKAVEGVDSRRVLHVSDQALGLGHVDGDQHEEAVQCHGGEHLRCISHIYRRGGRKERNVSFIGAETKLVTSTILPTF